MEPANQTQKRRIPSDGRMSYPRKRAVTACQLCRGRKTKCDNQRPACGTCLALEVPCNYQDRTTTDLSSFDPASLAILDRLNTAIQLLENQAHLPELIQALTTSQQSSVAALSNTSPGTNTILGTPQVTIPSDTISPEHFPYESSTTLEEALYGPENRDDVLNWPVFEGQFSSRDLTTAFFNQNDGGHHLRTGSHRRDVCEVDAPRLIRDFLQHVHIKNPILDPRSLTENAKAVAEEGFGWDGRSCLVLLACALASLAVPFSNSIPSSTDKSLLNAKDYPAGEAYYTAARKRIGLLDTSVLAIQCHFLLGVYQMYSMRPFKAWMSFNHACGILQTYLFFQNQQDTTPTVRREEQRLYWSCLKSECEMREQIDLPPSGLTLVNWPDMFPSPPGGSPKTDANVNSPEDLSVQLDVDIQKSWYYYLSEIACRRLNNRIAAVLHADSSFSWQLVSLPRLQMLAKELDGQVQRWAEHIPDFLTNMNLHTTDELTHMFMGRYLQTQELICRPFLYIVIHSDPSYHHSALTLSYARRCVDLHIKLLQHSSIKHRHHGSWFACRQRFMNALVLLAAVRKWPASVPDNWADHLQLALNMLAYFEDEAPDLSIARHILIDLRDASTSASQAGG